MKDEFKEMLKASLALGYSGYMKLMNVKSGRVVLYYHDFNPEDTANFRKQMEYLAENHRVVKPSLINSIDPEGNEHLVAITIDDAFENVYQNAIPILKEYALDAAVFAPVGNLGEKPNWDIPENSSARNCPLMDNNRLIEIDRQGFEIFSHTYSHPKLTEIDSDKLKKEITESKLYLEKLLGHEVNAISYPHGDHDERVCSAAMQAGYKLGFTVKPAMISRSTDSMRIGRFKVTPDESLMKFKLKCTGAYHVLQSVQTVVNAVSFIKPVT